MGLFDPIWMKANLEGARLDKALDAVQAMTDQKDLQKMVLRARHWRVVDDAIRRIDDQAFLARVAMGQEPVAMNGAKSSAAGCLTDQVALAQVASSSLDEDARIAAIVRMDDLVALAGIARDTANAAEEEAAEKRAQTVIEHADDPLSVTSLIDTCDDPFVGPWIRRCLVAAIGTCKDPRRVRALALCPDEVVCRAAVKRLRDYFAFGLHPNVEALDTLVESALKAPSHVARLEAVEGLTFERATDVAVRAADNDVRQAAIAHMARELGRYIGPYLEEKTRAPHVVGLLKNAASGAEGTPAKLATLDVLRKLDGNTRGELGLPDPDGLATQQELFEQACGETDADSRASRLRLVEDERLLFEAVARFAKKGGHNAMFGTVRRIHDTDLLERLAYDESLEYATRAKAAQQAGIADRFGARMLVCKECGKPVEHRVEIDEPTPGSWRFTPLFGCVSCKGDTSPKDVLERYSLAEADLDALGGELVYLCPTCGKLQGYVTNLREPKDLDKCTCKDSGQRDPVLAKLRLEY